MFLGALLVIGLVCATPVHADGNDLIGGVGDILQGVFALPMGILAGTMSGPPILGTVMGVVNGAMGTLQYTLRGTFRVLGAVIPLAKSAAPFVLPFLF